jgi:hypothetical protein
MNESPDNKKYIDWGDIRSGRVNISQTGGATMGGYVSGDKFVGRDPIDWGESKWTISAHMDHALEYIRTSTYGTADQRRQLAELVAALKEQLVQVKDQEQPDAGIIAERLEAMARELTYTPLNRHEISCVTDDVLKATELLPATAAPTQQIAELVRALCDEE